MVLSKTYYPTTAINTVTDGDLVMVNILSVSRSGIGYKEIDGIPSDGAREFSYEPFAGQIIFDPNVPFTAPPFGRPNRSELESVHVIYKI